MKPAVSVCLPILNGERFLGQAIESVINQSFSDWELLISDDCSQDASAEIVSMFSRQDSRIRYRRNQTPKGLFANYNECLRRASGKFIKPFAQDDILDQDMLATCVECLSSDSSAVLLGTARKIIDEYGGRITSAEQEFPTVASVFGSQRRLSAHQLCEKSLFPLKNLIGEPSAVVFRASSIGQGFDETLYQLGDLEYWLRIVLDGNFLFVDEPLSSFRRHSQSASATNLKGLHAALDMLRIGRSFNNIFQELGRSQEEYVQANLRAWSGAVSNWVRSGALSVEGVRTVDAALLHKISSASTAEEAANLTKRALADLADFRELCLRMFAEHGENVVTREAATHSPLVLRNEKVIKSREMKLRNLLSSPSWVMTRPLREVNRRLGLRRSSADYQPVEDLEEQLEFEMSERKGKATTVSQQAQYLKHLRNRIRRVISSRSWKLSTPLRLFSRSETVLTTDSTQAENHFPSPAVADLNLFDRSQHQPSERLAGVSQQRVEPYQAWLSVNQWNARSEAHLRKRLSTFEGKLPTISVVMPVFNPQLQFLEKAVNSLRSQVYDNWQLCIADDASTDPAVHEYLRVLGADRKIDVTFRDRNGHISEATNSAAELAEGDYLLFLDQDDELSPAALAEVALYIAERPETDLLYSDNDKIDADGRRYDPHFKPDWSPEMLLSYMYACQVMVVQRRLFDAVGGMRSGYEGSQDHDLALRISEISRHVGHIPLILYHWRASQGSIAQAGSCKPYSVEAGRKAVQDALVRRGSNGQVFQPEWARLSGSAYFAISFPDHGPSVTLIIPTKNNANLLRQCLESLSKTVYLNYQVLVVDNSSDDSETVAYLSSLSSPVLRIPNQPGQPFNFAYLINRAAETVDTDYVLFLNDDTQVVSPDWLSSMMGYAQLPNVGAVGAHLYFPDGRIQHAGVVHGLQNGLCGHAFKNLRPSQWSSANQHIGIARNYSAVTAACMLTPRQLFQESGGFDEETFPVEYNDPDYCYRLIDRGYRIVVTPQSKLIHHEGASRGLQLDPRAVEAYRTRYGKRNEPYCSPSFSRESEIWEIQPRRVITDGKLHIKTLICTNNLNLEGAPKVQLSVVRYLKAKGIIDPVVISRMDGPLRFDYESIGIPVCIKAPASFCNSDLQGYQLWLNELKQYAREQEIELVYANTIDTFDAIDASKELGIPSIWNIHESEPWQEHLAPLPSALANRAVKCFSYAYKVVFGSFATGQQYRQFDTRNNFMAIHNGLDQQALAGHGAGWTREAARSKLQIEGNEIGLLMLGTVCERKGQLDMLEALRYLKGDLLTRLRLFIVGDKNLDYSRKLKLFAAELPESVRNRVSLLPETDDTALFYRAADIFVCSSRRECYPCVILESMAYDLPIITTPVFGIAEQVVAGVNADFYTPGDARELANKVAALVGDERRRSNYSAASSRVLNSLITAEQTGESFASIFQEAYFSSTPQYELSTSATKISVKPVADSSQSELQLVTI